MKYTVKQLAEYSGVSTRTLRFYDKIDLLSPAFYGDNGYRFYSETELLTLQQILFFRELGFKLADIKNIINTDEFDQLESLKKHRINLMQKIVNFKKLVKSIDKTTAHLKGELKMKDYELYTAFKHPKQIEMVTYLKNTIPDDMDHVLMQSKAKMATLSPDDMDAMKEESAVWAESFKQIIEANDAPESSKAQALMRVYYQRRIKRFCDPTPKLLIALCEAECNHPEYKIMFDNIHPEFATFFLSAIKHYAKTTLKSKVVS
jgi:MerR family transcriptional regulator, thiopeptide resistance regulator